MRRRLPSVPSRARRASLLLVTALAACTASWLIAGGRAPRLESAYFYDLQAGRLFVADSALLPPIAAPSGGPGVRAFVFSCGNCADSASRQIGFLTAGKERFAASSAAERATDMQAQEVVVRRVADVNWLPMSDSGAALVQQVLRSCSGPQERLTECTP